MTGVSLRMIFPALWKRFTARMSELDLFIAAQLQTNRGLLFDAEGDRNGNEAWPKPLLRNGQAGAMTGHLRQSIAPKSADGRAGAGGFVRLNHGLVEIGSNLIYAAQFNWGGTIEAKNGKALRIPLPAGKRATPAAKQLRKGAAREQGPGKSQEAVIYRKRVHQPPHRFDNLTEADTAEIAAALENKLAQLLGEQHG